MSSGKLLTFFLGLNVLTTPGELSRLDYGSVVYVVAQINSFRPSDAYMRQ